MRAGRTREADRAVCCCQSVRIIHRKRVYAALCGPQLGSCADNSWVPCTGFARSTRPRDRSSRLSSRLARLRWRSWCAPEHMFVGHARVRRQPRQYKCSYCVRFQRTGVSRQWRETTVSLRVLFRCESALPSSRSRGLSPPRTRRMGTTSTQCRRREYRHSGATASASFLCALHPDVPCLLHRWDSKEAYEKWMNSLFRVQIPPH